MKLTTGTTIAQAIPIAISPILTRIYTPDEFGVLALFTAITAILGSISNARYELSIVLPEKEEDAINLVALSILISFTLSSFLFLVILMFQNNIIKFLGNSEINLWLYFVPLVVFMIGIFNAFKFYNTRIKKYNIIAQVSVLKSVSLAISQILLGLLKFGHHGLILGQIFSHLFSNGRLAKSFLKNSITLSNINIKRMLVLAKTYIKFPKFSMGATLANTSARNITSLFIPMLYSAATLGHFSLVQRTLGLPTNLVGQSIGQIFIQKAVIEKQKYGTAKIIYISTLKKLLTISLIPFIILFFTVEDIIVFIFGDNWLMAGVYAKILVPLFFLRFIAAPLNLTLTVFEKQQIDLLWQCGLLLIVLVTVIASAFFKLDIISFFITYSIILCVYYILNIIISYKVSIGNVD
ncbi:oligosaccharide flippase family protein [Virgibacillus sp. YIM 98842]|uniref:oligosaccharide flippase family protein n=1 Tax=Virgibacillus sp. YIM 98842 TaxID=2663533 RepID=UPI0013DA3455|nr:oligosaccharide flippase family protein [Virgibacillus sp. YIM 98842]